MFVFYYTFLFLDNISLTDFSLRRIGLALAFSVDVFLWLPLTVSTEHFLVACCLQLTYILSELLLVNKSYFEHDYGLIMLCFFGIYLNYCWCSYLHLNVLLS